MAIHIRRREFIGGATAWPLAARARQPAKLPIIGFFSLGSAAAMNNWVSAFVQGLRECGWIEGRTVAIEYRWAEGRTERLAEIAAEFVRLKVDVIVTHSAAPVAAAKRATSVIPIVFAVAADPLGTGLVESLALPGGNVTGFSVQTTDLAAKRLELMRELVPSFRRVAILANAGNPAADPETREVQRAARTLGLEATISEIQRAEDIPPAIEALKGHADVLYVAGDPLLTASRLRISILALAARLATVFGVPEFISVGGLMAYGPNFPDMFRRAANYVDKILRGAKPGELPVEQPTKFELVLNLTTARALGIEVPSKILALADEVIE
jgi:putative ABC transport system substrate-binding protein